MIQFRKISDCAEMLRLPRVVSVEEWCAEGVVGDVVGVDFETFYSGAYSVAKLGTWAYCRDPRFDAYLVAVADRVKVCVCRPEEFPWETIEGLEWVSHNREFDWHVYERLISHAETQRRGACRTDFLGGVQVKGSHAKTPGLQGGTNWWCSAAVCAFLQLPRDLAGAVEAVFGVPLDKGTRKRAQGKSGEEALDDEMLQYAARDAVACLALWDRLGCKWPEQERQLFELTCDMGRVGLAVDWEHVEGCREHLVVLVQGLSDTLPWSPALSLKQFGEWCEATGVPVPESKGGDDPGFLAWKEEYGDAEAAGWVETMQRIRSANRTEKVLRAMSARRRSEVGSQRSGDGDDRMPYELKYCGANTGRWSGGGGLNLQNLNRSGAEGVDLRQGIVASPGHVLGVVDFAQIESRVLLWLAGDHETLEMLRENPELDVYEAHARGTMGWRPECGVGSAECGVEENLKQFCARTGSGLRQLAKARVLGLGFGCGAEKFMAVAKSMAGLDLSLEESVRIVGEYRESNPKVVGLWRRLESACRAKVGGDYVLPLPCTQWDRGFGRFLIYRDVHLVMNQIRCVVGGKPATVYGGLLAENFTQGTARDVLAAAWLRCAEAGFLPVLSVHDELVFELPEDRAEDDLKRIVELMVAPLPWAEHLPLQAEGNLMKVYQK